MELTKLEFAVNTDQLKEAVALLGKVQEGTAALGKEEQKRSGGRKKLTDEEKAANEESKKAAAAAKKAAAEQKKLGEEGQATANKLEKLKDQLKFLRGELVQGETGFTKMQAGVMSAALAAGASTDVLKEYAETFDNFNRITGQNPFDKSVGGLKFLDSELNRLQKTTELATEGFKLTQNQIKLLAQDTEALTQVNKARGASEEDINRIVSEHKKVFGERAVQLNEQIERSKELEKQTKSEANTRIKAQEDARTYSNAYWKQEFKNLTEGKLGYKEAMGSMADYYRQLEKDSKKTSGSTAVKVNRELATSTKWLANEEAKMISVLNTLNMSQNESNSLNEKAARSISNYERNLRQAGITGAEAAKKLELYREQQTQIQTIEQRNQGKFLSRALQPQIGDVAVSLAAGQNPLTVMLQQGDQIRGLIAQSGIEGAALQKIMRDAFSSTLTSIKDTAVAMGSVLGGAFISLGKSVTGLVTGPFSAFTFALAQSKSAGEGLAAGITGGVLPALKALNVAMLSFMRIPIVSAVAALVALGVAAYQSIGQATELSKALALNSAAFNMNRADAIAYAESLGTADRSSAKYVDIITTMAQAGYKAGSNFKLVADSAIDMEKYAGVAIEDTIKKFADLSDKPYEGVAKLAKETGKVGPEIIKLVAELERQGKVAEASAIATKAMADVNSQVVNQIAADAGYLERAWTATINFLKNLWSGFRDSVLGWGATESVEAQIKGVQERIEKINKGASSTGALGAVPAKQKAALEAQLEGLQEQQRMVAKARNAEAERAGLASAMVSYQTDINNLMDNQAKRAQAINKATQENNRLVAAGKITEEEAAKRIKGIEEKFKDKKEPKSDAQKAAEKEQKALNAAMEKYNDILGVSLDYSSTWNNDIADLDLLLKKQKISQEQYNDARSKLFEQQPYAKKVAKEQADAAKEFADNQKLINDLIGKGDDLGKGYNSTMEKLESLRGKSGIDPKDLDAAIEALKRTTPAAKAYEAVLQDYSKTMSDVAISRKAVQEAYQTDFMTEAQKKEFESLQKYQKSTEQAEIEYRDNISKIKGDKESSEYKNSVIKYQEMAEAKKQLAKDVYDRERYLQSDLYQMYSAGFDALKGLAKDFGAAVTDEFMNFATTGKSSFEALTSSFGSMIQKMIYDLIRLRIQKQVTGLFDALITMGVNAMMGGSPTAATSPTSSSVVPNFTMQAANGAAFMNGVQMYAKGGVFDGPTMFQHSGGLGVLGEAGSEAVMPLKRDSSGSLGVVAQVQGGGGSATQVVVNNYSSEKATATESIDSRGNRSIEVTVGDMVSSQLSKSGSSSQKAMRGTFGMQPQLIRR